MPTALRRAVIGVLFVLLASWAWLPVFQSGLHGVEVGLYRALLEPDSPPQRHGGHLWFGLAPLLAAPVLLVRLEAACWLLLAAFALGRSARRLLLPWSGGELARAAGWSTSLLFALHPLAVSALASLTARGDLIGLAFGACAVWAYLHARQERAARSLALAALCAVLASFASSLAISLPAWLAGAEYLSAHRQRKPATRARSALGAAAGALACVLLPALVASLLELRLVLPQAVHELGTRLDAQHVAHAFEHLGTLFLPVNSAVVGGWGFALAGFLALAALQPILVAARSAPRLWGRILGVWALALVVAESFGPLERVHPGDLRDGAALLGAVAVLSIGLGLGSVAVSGPRRVVLPMVLGLGFAVLAHSSATAHRSAARELAALERALEQVEAPDVWVLDAPGQVLGVRCAEGALEGRGVEAWSSDSLALLALGPDFDARRARGLEVVAWSGGEWQARRLAAPRADEPPPSWFREGRSPELELDPCAVRALVVRATSDADTSRPPVLAWRSSELAGGESGRLVGAWAYLGEAPEAVFDLSSSLEWLTAAPIRQVWSAEGWSRISQAEFAREFPAPALAGNATVVGEELVVPLAEGAEADDGRRVWSVCVLERAHGRVRSFLALRRGSELACTSVVAGVGAELAWVEARIDGHVVERAAVALPRR